MICWENEEAPMFRVQRRELKDVFEQKYNFDAREVDIPVRKKEQDLYPEDFLVREVQASQKSFSNNKTRNLLIVYYGGHGIRDRGCHLRLSRSVKFKLLLEFKL